MNSYFTDSLFFIVTQTAWATEKWDAPTHWKLIFVGLLTAPTWIRLLTTGYEGHVMNFPHLPKKKKKKSISHDLHCKSHAPSAAHT